MDPQKYSLEQLRQDIPSRKKAFLSIFLIIILGFSVYANTFNNKFVWDDEVLVVNNPYIRDWNNLKAIFTEDVGAGTEQEYYFYRPLPTMTYLLDYSLWKLNPKGYHLTNILWHIMAALALYWFTMLLFKDQFLSLVTSIFFVIHPIHTEVVTYISGRSDALALFFILLSFIFYIKHLHHSGAKFYISMGVCYAAALLSRENSLIFPALLLLFHFIFKERVKLKGFLSIIGIAGMYVLLRLTFLKDILSEMPKASPLLERLPGVFVAIANYTRLLLLPFNLHMEYGESLFSPLAPKVFIGMAIILLMTYILRRYQCSNVTRFSAFWFFISILPVSNIIPLNAYMAEHWLYLPSIGFFLILAEGTRFLYQQKNIQRVTFICLAGLLGFYSFQTIKQNTYWRDPVSFYQRTLCFEPNSFAMNHNLGLAYYKMGKYEEAISLYEKAIKVKPDSTTAYNHLGVAYFAVGDNEGAIAAFKKALVLDLKLATTYYNLGNVYSANDQKQKAISMFDMAIRFKPDYAEAYNNLGAAYADVGNNEVAILSYIKVIELNPDNADAYNNLGVAYDNINQTEKAIDSFKKAMELDPKHMEAYANLSRVYLKTKQYSLAVEYFDKAQELGFTNPVLLKTLEQYR